MHKVGREDPEPRTPNLVGPSAGEGCPHLFCMGGTAMSQNMWKISSGSTFLKITYWICSHNCIKGSLEGAATAAAAGDLAPTNVRAASF